MGEKKKTLKVSYGTFSCTLEGFDDPLGTMKTVVEFFRDIAAQDRHFGVEPIAKDPRVINAIAGRVIDSAVEVHDAEDTIVFRQRDAGGSDQGRASASAALDGEPDMPGEAETFAGLDADDVSTDFDDLPNPNDRPLNEPAVPQASPAQIDALQHGRAGSGAPAMDDAASSPGAADASDGDATVQDPVPADESVAAKLERIRAIVSRKDAESAAFDEDEHADAEQDASPAVAPEPLVLGAADAVVADGLAQDGGAAGEAAARPGDETGWRALARLRALGRNRGVEGEQESAADGPPAPEPDRELMSGAPGIAPANPAPALDGSGAAERFAENRGEDQRGSDSAVHAGQPKYGDDARRIQDPAEVPRNDEEAVASSASDVNGLVDADADFGRIMDEAGNRLDSAENEDRRSEIARLRSVMAAGKAAGDLTHDVTSVTDDAVYRADLASAVATAPEAMPHQGSGAADAPAAPGGAIPLRLVPAQRVETDDEPPVPDPVPDMEGEAAETIDFTQYAERVQAHDLHDLLEAGAAYLSLVKGYKQFSRMQLMTEVQRAATDGFTREDGLRSFGLLLRDGKIEKTSAGRFTISERIGFRPKDMRATG